MAVCCGYTVGGRLVTKSFSLKLALL